MKTKIVFVNLLLVLGILAVSWRLFLIAADGRFAELAKKNQSRTFTVASVNGNIYTNDFSPLIYQNQEKFYIEIENNKPVLKTETSVNSPIIANIPQMLAKNQTAQHIIGYELDGEGITGILGGYNAFLHSNQQKYNLTYQVNGLGEIISGLNPEISQGEKVTAGVVTTIDKHLQEICENVADENMEKGAIVVMDVASGEIRAMVSRPVYSSYDIASALEDENSPLINRALRPFSVGSCFKLLIAAEGLAEGLGDFECECIGYDYVHTQLFHCHTWAGHDMQNMENAIGNSCNIYFIQLAQRLNIESLYTLAKKFGFGTAATLGNGIYSNSGNLPTLKQLSIPAELANFSFGQGVLTATPVQVAKMTCIIANGGLDVKPTLVKGVTLDGKTLEQNTGTVIVERIISKENAQKLKNYMKSAVYGNPTSNAKTVYTVSSAKTSTAQTGRKDENGNELYNAWVTGFFPSLNPQYAITILCEDGGYGNAAAAPILKAIVDEYAQGLPPL